MPPEVEFMIGDLVRVSVAGVFAGEEGYVLKAADWGGRRALWLTLGRHKDYQVGDGQVLHAAPTILASDAVLIQRKIDVDLESLVSEALLLYGALSDGMED